MEDKTLFYKDIGEVKYVVSVKARYISISVKPFSPVRVTIPSNVSLEAAERFLKGKMHWVHKHQEEMKKQGETIFNENTRFITRFHKLVIQKHEKNTLKISVSQGLIRIFYPAFTDSSHPKVQNAVRKAIEEAWRIEAKAVLPKRVDELAKKFGFHYLDVFIKNARTRWGSCSHNDRINLSLHLMMLPDHLIDYVILHELTHTLYKNHGKRFWHHLGSITGRVEELEKEINRHKIGIL